MTCDPAPPAAQRVGAGSSRPSWVARELPGLPPPGGSLPGRQPAGGELATPGPVRPPATCSLDREWSVSALSVWLERQPFSWDSRCGGDSPVGGGSVASVSLPEPGRQSGLAGRVGGSARRPMMNPPTRESGAWPPQSSPPAHGMLAAPPWLRAPFGLAACADAATAAKDAAPSCARHAAGGAPLCRDFRDRKRMTDSL